MSSNRQCEASKWRSRAPLPPSVNTAEPAGAVRWPLHCKTDRAVKRRLLITITKRTEAMATTRRDMKRGKVDEEARRT